MTPPRDAPASSMVLPSVIAVAVFAMLLSSAVSLTQSDGDLFAHIALGRQILVAGIPSRVTPAWGSAVLLAWCHEVGGLRGIVMFVAAMAAAAHALVTHSMLQAGIPTRDALLGSVMGITLAASHWLARPHAVTLLFLALLMWLLTSTRWAVRSAIVPMFAVWANLHGGWSFGLLLLVAYTTGELVTWWSRRAPAAGPTPPPALVQLLAITACAAAATFATPYGHHLHEAVARTLGDAELARTIDEYRPPSWSEPVDVLFLVVALATVPGLLLAGRRPSPAVWLVVALSLLSALRASRNISLFAFTGWPLLVTHLAAPRRREWSAQPVRPARHAHAVAGVVILLGGTGVGLTVGRSDFTVREDPRRFPVGAMSQLQGTPPTGRLFTTWTWSGYVPFAAPGQRAWFDPLAFTTADMRTLGIVLEQRPGWRAVLDSLGIGTVLVPRRSVIASALERDARWARWYGDDTAVVFRRQPAPAASP